MIENSQSITALLASVRSRWRQWLAFQAVSRSAVAIATVLIAVLLAARWTTSAAVLAGAGVATLLFVAVALAWGARSARRHPSDARVARLIEERHPSLDDRLVSAVDLLASAKVETRSALAGPMLADAGRAASAIDARTVISDERLRRAGGQAVAALLLLGVVAFAGRDTAERSFDALSLLLFPAHATLDVVPGNARIAIGSPLTIEARLVGNRAPVEAHLEQVDAAGVSADVAGVRMKPGGTEFHFDAVKASFKYRIVAGALTSAVYDVTVLRPPRVTRIDLEYRYPSEFGLAPQSEEDSGDIYAPAGTDVRIRVTTDPPLVTGQMTLGDGTAVPLAPLSGISRGSPSESTGPSNVEGALTTELRVVADNSYRIALADRDGLKNTGDTEYFIRVVTDRPPEVHVRKPARDRSVTKLEEVEIEAEAQDDFGVDHLELVYAVRGGAEHTVPLTIDAERSHDATTVTGRHLLSLEDLDVEPGDFVSYYVRARDRGRGRHSIEGRSDIFFLDVRPFEQEFVMARSQASGSAGNRALDDLVASQKEIIVATWKLDRRIEAAGAKSEDDIRAVSKAELDLKKRVEETSSSFRGSNLRDPRQVPQPGSGPAAPRAGQARPEEDAMTVAARAMGRAVASLDRLKTADAIPAEMDALNHLLKAQSDVRRQQITQQQAGSGGSNKSNVDMSSLFDRELQRDQQTNYEVPPSATKASTNLSGDLADRIKDLAHRQDDLNQRQRDAAGLTADERRRELEKLARDQSDLRQRVEDLAKEMEDRSNQPGQSGRFGRSGRSSGSGQSQTGSMQPGQSGRGSQTGQQMRGVSEAMRNAADDLRRQDPQQAGARGTQALDRLQAIERQLRSDKPDDRRRAVGEVQLEARQIAEAERELANQGTQGSRGSQGSQGLADRDTLRRLAGEQDRLADRARRVQDALDQAAAMAGSSADADNKDLQRAIGAAAGDLNRQRSVDRMKQSAEELRAAANQSDDRQAQAQAARASAAQESVARDMENLADKLADAQAPQDAAARRLADERARALDLRDDINRLTADLDKLQNGSSTGRSDQPSPGDRGSSGRGQAGRGGTGSTVAQLREEYQQRLQETRELLDELRRDDPTFSQGGAGLTFQGRGMTMSAPGSEAFKQDFATWQQLREQATRLLDQAATSLSKQLLAANARDRLAGGSDDTAPVEYQRQVDDYFKALATRKK